MSIWTLINEAREQEYICASLGVEYLQRFGNPCDFFDKAALYRAQRYEFRDTARILEGLHPDSANTSI